MILFTTAETAVYLRLKERKLYELVAEQAIPCTKVTGKWLFPKHELDNWLREGLSKSSNASPSIPLPIVGGSHDPLLEWALRESGSPLAALSEGTEAGLTRFATGEIVTTAAHLHASEEGDANKDASNADTVFSILFWLPLRNVNRNLSCHKTRYRSPVFPIWFPSLREF